MTTTAKKTPKATSLHAYALRIAYDNALLHKMTTREALEEQLARFDEDLRGPAIRRALSQFRGQGGGLIPLLRDLVAAYPAERAAGVRSVGTDDGRTFTVERQTSVRGKYKGPGETYLTSFGLPARFPVGARVVITVRLADQPDQPAEEAPGPTHMGAQEDVAETVVERDEAAQDPMYPGEQTDDAGPRRRRGAKKARKAS